MRDKLRRIHQELCQKGHYCEARRILDLLRNKRVNLGLEDIDWDVSIILEKIGFKISQTTRYGRNIYQLI